MKFLEQLAQTAYAFDFHGAMRRLEAVFQDRPRFGEAVHPADERVRVGQDPSVAFAPSAITSFTPPTADRPGRLAVAFTGMFGPNGPLPLHLTEYARERIRHVGDRTLSAFVDLFNHRMLLLFHRAWAQADPTANLDRPGSNRFDLYVGALLGIGQTALQNRESIPDRAKLQYAGWLSNPVRCADGLRAILEDYFEIPVSIEEFRGEWLPIPHDARLALGGPAETSALGRTAMVGRRAYSVQDRFRVCAGPLTRDELCRFLPGSPSLVRLEALVRSYAGDELSWDLRLRLRPDADCQVRLGGGERLAYNARVGSGVAVADVIIDPTTRQRPHAEN